MIVTKLSSVKTEQQIKWVLTLTICTLIQLPNSGGKWDNRLLAIYWSVEKSFLKMFLTSILVKPIHKPTVDGRYVNWFDCKKRLRGQPTDYTMKNKPQAANKNEKENDISKCNSNVFTIILVNLFHSPTFAGRKRKSSEENYWKIKNRKKQKKKKPNKQTFNSTGSVSTWFLWRQSIQNSSFNQISSLQSATNK